MAILLPAQQLRMAIEMECRGYALYSRAMQLTQDAALLALNNAVGQVLRNGLDLLGVTAPERM